MVAERSADVEEGFSQAAPLIFHYGHKSPNDNLQLYNMLVSRLAEIINVRSEQSKRGEYIFILLNPKFDN